MNIAVVGTGYVGLVSGTCFAELGHTVYCVDINKEKVDSMKNGQIPIYEPGLQNIFSKNINAKRLYFTTKIEEALAKCNVIFLALPTPPDGDGSADLSFVLNASKDIAKLITEYTVIVNKSTVPVGTADKVTEIIKSNCSIPFDVVSNPEFLKEGYAVEDFMKPDRVIIGASSEKAFQVLREVYKPLTNRGFPLLEMDEKSSELTKYAANSFLATKISFMNEIANYCDLVGANVDKVKEGIGIDPRIGSKFLNSGIGYGGSCFPKDVQALIKSGKEVNYDFLILNSVEKVNKKQKTILIPEVEKHLGDLEGKTISLWGLAFKENTDDIRDASSIDIIKELLSKKAIVKAYDPVANENIKKIFGDSIQYFDTMYDCVENADALIIVTEWNEFRTADLSILSEKVNNKAIFDGRNVLNINEVLDSGFYYRCIGRNIK